MSRITKPTRRSYEAVHRQFGTAGLVLSIVALVFSMGAGAYAARHHKKASSTATIKKEAKKWSKKYSKQFAKPGPQGPQGDPGAAGANGKDGANGSSGADGSDGEDGTSVTGTPLVAGEEGCEAGGVLYSAANGDTPVCNGENGLDGTDGEVGSPWTAGGTLPSGKTETGAWTSAGAAGTRFEPISFFLPLPAGQELDGSGCGPNGEETGYEGTCEVHYILANGEELLINLFTEEFVEVEPADCTGSPAAPTAPPGHLCIYEGGHGGTAFTGSGYIFPVSTFGTIPNINAGSSTAGVRLQVSATSIANLWGSYAVTAQ